MSILDNAVSAVAGTAASTLESELAYISGVDAYGSAANANGWQPVNSFPRKWGTATPGTAGGTISYSFYPDYYGVTPVQQAAIQQTIGAGLALWAAVANIHFQLVPYSDATPAPITFHYDPFNDQAHSTGTAAAVNGNALGGGLGTIAAAESTFNPPQLGLIGSLSSFTATGGYGIDTILHEEGHLLGLGVAGPYNGTVNPATQQLGPYDSRLWSVMSYINPADATSRYRSSYNFPAASWGYDANGYAVVPTTLMPLDILAVQRLYGVPTSTPLSGGQTFGFHCNVDPSIAAFFDFTVNQRPVVTLWDRGFGNTLDVSGFAGSGTVDLRPGAFSSVDGMVDNIGIAFGVAIDNAVGGPGNEIFVLNSRSDSIVGGGGSDIATLTQAGVFWSDDGGATRVVSGGGVVDALVGVAALAFAGGADTIVTHAGGGFALGGGHNLMFVEGAAAAQVWTGGADTIVGVGGALAITAQGPAGAAGDLIFAGGEPLSFLGGATPDTVVGGAATVTAGAAAVQAYGVGAELVFQGGAGVDIAAASSGRLVAQAGPAGALLVGGTAGGNVLTAGAGPVTVFAGGAADIVTFANAAIDIAVLGSGAETVQGAAATAGFSVYCEAANAVVVGGPGNDGFVAGHGNSTLFGGGGINAFVVVAGQGGGTTTIADWNPSRDYVFLEGYGAGADAAALATQAHSGGSTVVTLPDQTHIVFVGAPGIAALY